MSNSPPSTSSGPPSRRRSPRRPTRQAGEFQTFVRTCVSAVIGLMLAGLFCLTILSIVVAYLAGTGQPEQLTTALTLAGSALGGVLGYFLARPDRER